MSRIEELRALRKRERDAAAAVRPSRSFESDAYMAYMNARGALDNASRNSIDALLDCAEALKYARRFLNAKDHDVAYIDAALAKLEGGK